MGQTKQDEIVYNDGRTKQAFKNSTDINKILQRAQKTGTISHLAKHGKAYGDFADFDFFEAQTRLAAGRSIFEELPSEVRREFQNDPGRFFAFANDPENVGRLGELLPKIAEKGNYWPTVIRNAGAAAPSEPETPEVPETPPEVPETP